MRRDYEAEGCLTTDEKWSIDRLEVRTRGEIYEVYVSCLMQLYANTCTRLKLHLIHLIRRQISYLCQEIYYRLKRSMEKDLKLNISVQPRERQ